MQDDILLSVRNLKVQFKIYSKDHFFDFKPKLLTAVNDISFDLQRGEILGVVGESGCGKSTLARAIIGLVQSQSGNLEFEGKDILSLDAKQQRATRKDIQMIFQDPLASLDPRMTIGDIIAEPLYSFFPSMSNVEVKKQIQEVMAKVGILPNLINRYPHEFSGGQCQRIGIARALVLKPKLIICDEPVSALDVSIQAQVTNLLKQLQKEMQLSLIFIAHDLSVVKHISDRVLVMYLGNFVELADKKELYAHPSHPYTKALISAVPIADPRLERSKSIQLLEGDLPSPINPPSGCHFRTRCIHADEQCAKVKPTIVHIKQGHKVACLKA